MMTSITIGASGAVTEFQGSAIPLGCICSYTWDLAVPGRIVRNGAVLSCPADHSLVDGQARDG
jgi:hypothetical protein